MLHVFISFLLVFVCKVESTSNHQGEGAVLEDLLKMIKKIKVTECGENYEKGETPAFTATTSKTQSLGPNEIPKFEKVWTNEGNGYDPNTGIFTAPRLGLYHISGTVMSESGKLLHVHLIRNDDLITSPYPGHGLHTGTVNVVLKLQKGDRVYFKHTNRNELENMYSDVFTYCVFSGFFNF